VRVAVFGAHAVAGARILASASHGTGLLVTREVGLARGVPDLLVRSVAREKGSRERFLLSSATFLCGITRAELRVVCAVTLAVAVVLGGLARACDGRSGAGTALFCLVTGAELRKASAVALAIAVVFLRLTSAENSPIRNCQNRSQKFRVVSRMSQSLRRRRCESGTGLKCGGAMFVDAVLAARSVSIHHAIKHAVVLGAASQLAKAIRAGRGVSTFFLDAFGSACRASEALVAACTEVALEVGLAVLCPDGLVGGIHASVRGHESLEVFAWRGEAGARLERGGAALVDAVFAA